MNGIKSVGGAVGDGVLFVAKTTVQAGVQAAVPVASFLLVGALGYYGVKRFFAGIQLGGLLNSAAERIADFGRSIFNGMDSIGNGVTDLLTTPFTTLGGAGARAAAQAVVQLTPPSSGPNPPLVALADRINDVIQKRPPLLPLELDGERVFFPRDIVMPSPHLLSPEGKAVTTFLNKLRMPMPHVENPQPLSLPTSTPFSINCIGNIGQAASTCLDVMASPLNCLGGAVLSCLPNPAAALTALPLIQF